MLDLLDCAVYSAKDIQRLYHCGPNEICRLIELGTIPRPLPGGGRYSKRRWSKAAVHKKLGMQPVDEIRALVRQVLADELARTGHNAILR